MSAEPAWWGGDHDDAVISAAMRAGASQDAYELMCARDIARSIDPAVIVEIGCDRGGTLLVWKSLCPWVAGITTRDNGYDSGGSGLPLDAHGAKIIWRDSHDPAARAELRMWTGRRPVDVLVVDGDHHVEGVRKDLAMYGPLVRPGGLILLHDINSSEDPRAEVWKVWPELRDRYDTTDVINPQGGFGWGIITVHPGDRFEEEQVSKDDEGVKLGASGEEQVAATPNPARDAMGVDDDAMEEQHAEETKQQAEEIAEQRVAQEDPAKAEEKPQERPKSAGGPSGKASGSKSGSNS